jgi:hypothetical protein
MNLLDKAWEVASKNQRKILLVGLLIFAAFEFREYAIEKVHGEVYSIIKPMRKERDLQLKNIENQVNHIADDTKEIKRILMERK